MAAAVVVVVAAAVVVALFLLIVVLFGFLNIKSLKNIKKNMFAVWIFKCILSKVEILGVLHNLYIYIYYMKINGGVSYGYRTWTS